MLNLLYKISDDKKCVFVDKPVGVTPYQCVRHLADTHFPETKLGYAGRLDPMASGLLLLLVGDENKKKHKYEGLPKQYIVDILLGISTDSQDLLGVIKDTNMLKSSLQETLNETLLSFVGKHQMQYPIFSSKRVSGKPLFYHAREGSISRIEIPTKEIVINKIEIIQKTKITTKEIFEKASTIIPKIDGKFRQAEIIDGWKYFFAQNGNQTYDLIKIKVDCESGAFMRWLAEKIGKRLNTPALAFSIRRTKIGSFGLNELGLDVTSDHAPARTVSTHV